MVRFKIDWSRFINRLSLMSSLKLLVSEAKTSKSSKLMTQSHCKRWSGFWFAYILKTNSSYCSWTTVRKVHSCSSWKNALIKFHSVKECHHQNAFEQSKKDNLKKQVKYVEKISLSNALLTTIATTKTVLTKIITITTRTVVMTVLRTIMQMIYILVPNTYRIKVTSHNHRLMLIS